jgi:hypothetical protein
MPGVAASRRPWLVAVLAMVPQPRLNQLGERGQIVAVPLLQGVAGKGVTSASALISQNAISYTRCGCCGQHTGIMSPTSQTYSVTNQSTTASSQHHNCYRRCGARQVAGSHGRGSNRASPRARKPTIMSAGQANRPVGDDVRPFVPGTLDRGCAVEVLAQIPMTAWIRPSAMALTKLS